MARKRPAKSGPSHVQRPQPSRLLGILVMMGGVIIAGGLLVGRAFWISSAKQAVHTINSADQSLAAARRAITAQDWKSAREQAARALKIDPSLAAAHLIAGEAAARLTDYPAAMEHYAAAAAEQGSDGVSALFAAAELQRVVGSIDQSEVLFRLVLERQPTHRVASERLATLLKLTGRADECRRLLTSLVSTGLLELSYLQWLATPEKSAQAGDYLQQSLKRSPQQVYPRLGMAVLAMSRGEFSTARKELETLKELRPDDLEIHARLGRCLWELGDLSAFDQWERQLPVATWQEHADIWYLTGLRREKIDSRAASRAYLEALARNPDHAGATFRASQLLEAQQQGIPAMTLRERAHLLTQLAEQVEQLRGDASDEDRFYAIIESLQKLGRPWEGMSWAALLSQRPLQNPMRLQELASGLQKKAVQSTGPRDPLFATFDLVRKNLPLPKQSSVNTAAAVGLPAGNTTHSKVAFVDQAATLGIHFTYFEDPDPSTEGRRMPEFTGGGVAALDYDLNGWPDLYFTQGARLQPTEPAGEFLDELFQNRGTGHMVPVAEWARLREEGFSQGVASGDFNNDGFPDIYVANLGRNLLFMNLGDGTFQELTATELAPTQTWTTSCAIADLNQDGIPDLFDVTYVRGADLLDRRCQTPAGLRVCAPYTFAAAPDRLCLGTGTGTFEDVSATAPLAEPNGKGLGLLIAPLGNTRSLDLFIANDTEPNSLLRSESLSKGKRTLLIPQYHDQGPAMGLAVDYEGKAQACMGVAAADFNGDGRLDLYVTNYFNESNAFYLADEAGLFRDASHDSGLSISSFPMLGFGTQALDVDRDGDADLIVVNGDLDDFSHEMRSFRMRAQLYLNEGSAQFTEVLDAHGEDYFSTARAYRGRGLARLDWNRDGRPDFAVSHLDEPSAVVTNQSSDIHGWISLTLVGTQSSRDAIGARVTLQSSKPPTSTQTAWLTAGDGYQSCNERKILFGTGTNAGPFDLHVSWPSGAISEFTGIEPNSVYVVIEGKQSALPVTSSPGE